MPETDARRAQRTIVFVFGVLCVYFTGVFPPFSNPNELSRFETVVAAVEGQTFAIDGVIPVLGDHEDKSEADGHFYSNKAPGLAFAAIPVYRVLRLFLASPTTANADPIFRGVRLLTVSLLCLFALARFVRRLEAWTDAAVAPLVLCGVALGTPYLFYARSFFSHAWAAALIFLAWDALVAADETPFSRRAGALTVVAGLLSGWASISEYTVGPLLVLFSIRVLSGRRLSRFALFGLGAAVSLGLLGAYNSICFGAPWILSSSREAFPAYKDLARTGLFGFGPPSARVALDYLVHPARGILLFSPWLAWCIPGFWIWWKREERRSDCLLAMGATAVYFLLMTGYPNWHGGWSFGSRYLLPVLFFPAMGVGYALRTPLSRGLFSAAVVFSVAVNVLIGATFPYFPDDVAWPAATGALWFLERGWVAPNLLSGLPGGGALALAMSGAAGVLTLVLGLRAVGATVPRRAVAVLLGLAPLLVLLLRPPELPFGARLWRSAVYGAYSGRDPHREELRAVVLTAATPTEQRQALGAWRVYGPRRP